VSEKNLVIGIDFDNTIIRYDELLHRLAVERGLLKSSAGGQGGEPSAADRSSVPSPVPSKMDLRDEVRRLPGGELQWQKLQALAYGRNISEARLFDGVHQFLKNCRKNSVPVFIVSHKTEFPAADPGVSLRKAALEFMRRERLLGADGLHFEPSKHIFFESTREEKVKRIAVLGCTWFIDDLQETLLEKNFPPAVKRILFSPGGERAPAPDIKVMTSWKEINDFFFGH
jgi:hypothetical protein